MRLLSAAVVPLVALTSLVGCDDDDGPAVTTDDAAAPLTLEIRPVLEKLTESPQASTDSGSAASGDGDTVVLADPATDGGQLRLGPPALTAADIDSAEARAAQVGDQWSVTIDFTDEGNDAFGDLTGEAACAAPGAPGNRIAIVVDDEIVSAPAVNLTCGGRIEDGTEISGNFTRADAEELAERINDGQ